ncbi:MAG: DUF3887 domain-containing protein [Chitinophagaceae bacterium]
MTSKTRFLLVFLLGFLPALYGYSQASQNALAGKFLTLNQASRFQEAVELLAPQVRLQVNPEGLQQIWSQFTERWGNYLSSDRFTSSSSDSLLIIHQWANFEKDTLLFEFAFDRLNQIAGFHIIQVIPHPLPAEEVNPILFRQENDTLHSQGVNIYGTLMLPHHTEPFPVALIIAGSGPTDRNGNNPLGVSANPYLLLAQDLAAAGVASLRYDKRAIGESQIPDAQIPQLTLQDYIRDAGNWIRKMRKDPRFSSLVVIGHSEGSLIGMIAARKAHADGFISLAGPGQSLDTLLDQQLQRQLSPQTMDSVRYILQQLKMGRKTDGIPSSLSLLFSSSVQTFLISAFSFHPTVDISQLRIPVLIIQGENDLQVGTGNARLLLLADPRAKMVLIGPMTHLLKDAAEDRASNLATYTDPSLPLDTTLVNQILKFTHGLMHLNQQGPSLKRN